MAYAIRPLGFGEIVDTGVRLVRDHYGPILGIAASGYLPLILLQIWTASHRAAEGASVLVGLSMMLVFGVLVPFINTSLNMVLCDRYVGRSTGVWTVLRQTTSILPRVVGTTMLMGLQIMGAMLLLVIPGIWLMFALLLYGPIMVQERLFGRQALRRSRFLMDGAKWRAAMILMPMTLVIWAANVVAALALRAWPLLQAAVPGMVALVTAPFFTSLIVVFYFDVRCRREAFDLEHLAQLVEQGDGAPLTAA